MNERRVSSIPAVSEQSLVDAVSAVKNILDVREGRSGNAEDAYVTFKDLVDLQLAKAGTNDVAGSGVGSTIPFVPVSPPPETNLNPPPSPSNLTATGSVGAIFLYWEGAGYGWHSYTEIWRSEIDNLGDAVLVGTSATQFYADVVTADITYHYWVRFVSLASIAGPYSDMASAKAGLDPAKVLPILQGQVTSSALARDLSSRISNIENSITDEVRARLRSVSNEVELRTQALLDEAAEREAAITAEATIRQTEDESIAAEIVTITAALDDAVAAIETESQARADGDEAEALSRETLAAQIRGTYEGDDITALSTGLLYSERVARADADNALSTQISLLTAGVSGGFDPAISYYFDSGVEGWASDGDSSVSHSEGFLVVTATGADPAIKLSSDLSTAIQGSKYPVVKARISRTAGSTWKGALQWKTSGHGFSATYQKTVSEPPDWYSNDPSPTLLEGQFAVVEWDMSESADWMASSIQNIRLELGGGSDDDFEIDWVAVGRNGPGASTAALLDEAAARASADSAEATKRETLSALLVGSSDPTGSETLSGLTSGLIYSERTARADADSAQASSISVLETTVGGHTTSIAEQASSINGLQAQYTVKIDNNGFVSGFGLASEVVNGTPSSSFMVNADRFAVINPSGTVISVSSLTRSSTTATAVVSSGHGIIAGDSITISGSSTIGWNGSWTVTAVTSTSVQFTVPSTLTTPAAGTIKLGKASVPFIVQDGKAYLDTAVIKDASISSAKINSLVANKITAGYINAAIAISSARVHGAELYSGGTTLVTTDANGNVTGFAPQNATVEIAGGVAKFTVSNFRIYNTLGGGYIVPFEVVGGVTRIATAAIGDGTITTAKIANQIQSTNYVAGSTGWMINKSGTAEFRNITATGNITANSLNAATGTFTGTLSGVNGTFSGTLTADAVNAVNTVNIAGQAVTVPVYATGSDITVTSTTNQGAVVCSITFNCSGGGYICTFYANATANPYDSSGRVDLEKWNGVSWVKVRECKYMIHLSPENVNWTMPVVSIYGESSGQETVQLRARAYFVQYQGHTLTNITMTVIGAKR